MIAIILSNICNVMFYVRRGQSLSVDFQRWAPQNRVIFSDDRVRYGWSGKSYKNVIGPWPASGQPSLFMELQICYDGAQDLSWNYRANSRILRVFRCMRNRWSFELFPELPLPHCISNTKEILLMKHQNH